MEHRKYSRVDCRAEALIKYKDISFLGEVENLSLKGLFVKTDKRIEVGEAAEITVYFYGSSANFSFSLHGAVVRMTDEGIGLNFRKIDIGSVMHTPMAEDDDSTEQDSVLTEFRGFLHGSKQELSS